ncbi:hypothetical protein [Streptomyces mirabilis]|uniref:hypothetical protein n=1 Tax=Streptomyces mirabilis TaxID=68239 RepID=UPI003F4CB617
MRSGAWSAVVRFPAGRGFLWQARRTDQAARPCRRAWCQRGAGKRRPRTGPHDGRVRTIRQRPTARQWAAAPSRPVQAGPRGERLTPRGSGAVFRAVVRGQTPPWTPTDRATAQELWRLGFAALAAATPTERLGQTMGAAELGDAGRPLLVAGVATLTTLAHGYATLAALLAVGPADHQQGGADRPLRTHRHPDRSEPPLGYLRCEGHRHH